MRILSLFFAVFLVFGCGKDEPATPSAESQVFGIWISDPVFVKYEFSAPNRWKEWFDDNSDGIFQDSELHTQGTYRIVDDYIAFTQDSGGPLGCFGQFASAELKNFFRLESNSILDLRCEFAPTQAYQKHDKQ